MKKYLYLLFLGLTSFIHTSDSKSDTIPATIHSDTIETPNSSLVRPCETKEYKDAENLLGNPTQLQAYLKRLQANVASVKTTEDAQLYLAKQYKEELGATLMQTMPHNEMSRPIIYKVYELYATKK